MSRLLCFVLLVAAIAGAQAHEDLLGTHHVAVNGLDEGDCRHADDPCSSLAYAWSKSNSGDTIKVAEGTYRVDDALLERLLFGPIKMIGGYSTGDEFHSQAADQHRTLLIGGTEKWAVAARARGFEFTPAILPGSRGQQAAAAVASNCVQGSAAAHPCRNVDLLAQMRLIDFSSAPASASNLWGFVDRNDQHEYVVLGLSNGTAVVDITDPAHPREVGIVRSNSSLWRETKVYQFFDATANRYRAYAYISTEAPQTGIEIIDLTQLPNAISLAGRITEFGSSHTLYISNVEYAGMTRSSTLLAYLFIAGSNINGGAYLIYDLSNPTAPQRVSTAPAGTGYMHDSTSMIITDSRAAACGGGHNPCEVLVDFNESSVDLWDVTNKAQPLRLSTTTYPSARYTHSGWPSSDGRFLFVHDELDELRIAGFNTHIYALDLSSLTAPVAQTAYVGPTTTTDHNGYAKGDRYYVSHYRRGLVVFDTTDPTALREVGNFDTFLEPASDVAGTDGAWGTYPFFPSGTVVISDIDNGLFMLRDNTVGLSSRAGRLGFAVASVAASEGGSGVDVAVRRVDGRQGAVSLSYATADGTALAGSDYQAASGTLNWNDGDDTDRIVHIAVSNDATVESSETLSLMLSGASVPLDGAATITITLADDDTTPAPAPRSGGGGGSLSIELIIALAFLALLGRRNSFECIDMRHFSSRSWRSASSIRRSRRRQA